MFFSQLTTSTLTMCLLSTEMHSVNSLFWVWASTVIKVIKWWSQTFSIPAIDNWAITERPARNVEWMSWQGTLVQIHSIHQLRRTGIPFMRFTEHRTHERQAALPYLQSCSSNQRTETKTPSAVCIHCATMHTHMQVIKTVPAYTHRRHLLHTELGRSLL